MGKHKTMGGIKFIASKGTSFAKKPSETNYCVANEMKGKEFESRTAVQQAFVEALDTCGVNLKDETRKKFGIPKKKTPAKKTPVKK